MTYPQTIAYEAILRWTKALIMLHLGSLQFTLYVACYRSPPWWLLTITLSTDDGHNNPPVPLRPQTRNFPDTSWSRRRRRTSSCTLAACTGMPPAAHMAPSLFPSPRPHCYRSRSLLHLQSHLLSCLHSVPRLKGSCDVRLLPDGDNRVFY